MLLNQFQHVRDTITIHLLVFSNVAKTDDADGGDGGKAYAITPGRWLTLKYWLG